MVTEESLRLEREIHAEIKRREENDRIKHLLLSMLWRVLAIGAFLAFAYFMARQGY